MGFCFKFQVLLVSSFRFVSSSVSKFRARIFSIGIWFLKIESYLSGAISCYPFQSFAPNPGTKGFPFLSGLGHSFSKEKKMYLILAFLFSRNEKKLRNLYFKASNFSSSGLKSFTIT